MTAPDQAKLDADRLESGRLESGVPAHLLDTESAFPENKPIQVTFGIPF